MKKILYTATTHIHLLNFHLPYLRWFKEQGYEVHVACNGTEQMPFADVVHVVPFGRMPFDKGNQQAYKQLKQIIDSTHYDLIHCHTPMGGIVTRLAARRARKRGTKVFYTAHGFHFYKGASLKNWLLFFPIEWLFASFTDAIITINNEDFRALSKFNFPVKGKFKTDGIGINPDRIDLSPYNKEDVKQELGIPENHQVVLYIAEFIPRKNHRFIFNNIKEILFKNPNLTFVFTGGQAKLGSVMNDFAQQNGFQSNVKIMGYQTEIAKFIAVADFGISSSFAEGLPIGIAEQMSVGLPVVISNIRGHNELVEDSVNGFIFNLTDNVKFVNNLVAISQDQALRNRLGEAGKKSVKKFFIEKALEATTEIYRKYIDVN